MTLAEILLLRNLLIIPIAYCLMKSEGAISGGAVLSTEHKAIIIVRSILSYISIAASYESLKYLSMGLYSSIHVLQPLFSYFIGFCIFNRQMHITEIANFQISIIAIYIIAREEMPAREVGNEMREVVGGETQTVDFINGVTLKILSTVIAGLCAVMMVRDSQAPYSFQTLVQSIIGFIMSLVMIAAQVIKSEFFFTLEFPLLLLMKFIVSTLIATYTVLRGIKLDRKGDAVQLLFLNLIFGFGFDIFVYDKSLSLVIAASVCILILSSLGCVMMRNSCIPS